MDEATDVCPLYRRACRMRDAIRKSPGALAGDMTTGECLHAIGIPYAPGDSLALWVAIQLLGMQHQATRRGFHFRFKQPIKNPA